MKFTTTLRSKHGAVWGQHIMLPKKISAEIQTRENKRLLCTINETLTIHCAQMPDGAGQYFITINKEVCKKLKLAIGDKLSITLEKDTSKYGMPMPEEFKEILDTDPEGDKIFHELTMGKQRNLIYIVGKPKKSDTRITKALVVIEHIKTNGGKIDFKELNQQFKDYNNML